MAYLALNYNHSLKLFCLFTDNAALFCSFENTFCSFLEQDYTNDTTDWLYNQVSLQDTTDWLYNQVS